MAGIKETSDMLVLGLAGVRAWDGITEDGKINMKDLIKLFDVARRAPAAIIGASEIPAELLDLDEEELEILIGIVDKQFGFRDMDREQVVEVLAHVLRGCLHFMEAVKLLRKD